MHDSSTITNGKMVIQTSHHGPLLTAKLVIESETGTHDVRLVVDENGIFGSSTLADIQLTPDHSGPSSTTLSLTLAGKSDAFIKRIYFQVADQSQQQLILKEGSTRFFAHPSFFANEDGISLHEAGVCHTSTLMSMVLNEGEESVLFGVAELPSDYSFYELKDGVFRFGFDLKRPFPKNITYKLLIAHDPSPMRLLNSYGDTLSRFAASNTAPIQGWNSWDYYAQSVTMDDIRNEMKAIREKGLDAGVKTIVIDYGWETSLGDFRPNGKFPSSFKEMADEIREAGFVPGIWTAPLVAHEFSPIARHRQDLLTRKHDGNPVITGSNVVLDFSHPEYQAKLSDLYRRLYEAGFRVFKIDYIYQGTIDLMEQWHDMSIGKAELIRTVFQIARNAVGPECHIINCGTPVESCIGLTNSSRTSIDIHNFWGHIKNNAKQTALRLWQHRKVWAVDPDFAIIRCPDTSDDPYLNVPYVSRPYKDGDWHWFAGEESGLEEMKVALSFTYLAGGNMVLSDSISRLNDIGVKYLKKLFPLLKQNAAPVDLFENSIPRLWVGERNGKAIIGLFNFEDTDQPLTLPHGYAHLTDLDWTDFWSDERIRLSAGMTQKAHSVLLLLEV